MAISAVNEACVAAQCLYSAIQTKPIIDTLNEGGKTLNPNEPVECLELCGVTFYYPSHPEKKIIDALSLNICRGESLALVGPSGGGKVRYNKTSSLYVNCPISVCVHGCMLLFLMIQLTHIVISASVNNFEAYSEVSHCPFYFTFPV